MDLHPGEQIVFEGHPSWRGVLSFYLKGLVIAVVIIWMRVAWPRLREDQLQHLAWIVLVPLALAQLALTGVWVVVSA